MNTELNPNVIPGYQDANVGDVVAKTLQGIQFVTTSSLQGLQGLQGLDGSQGIQGIQGFAGSQGIQGIQGLQGLLGFQGLQGPGGGDSMPTQTGHSGEYLTTNGSDVSWSPVCTINLYS